MLSKKKLEQLYTDHSAELYAYLLRLTGSVELAEDILHDSFIKLLRYSEKKEVHLDTVRAFLFRTCHNLAVNMLRRTHISYTVPTKMYSDDVIESIENRDFIDSIYRLLQNLDAVSRSVFILKKELQCSNIEIAETLGVSKKTVGRKLEKTLQYLLQNIDRDDIMEFLLYICPFFNR